MHGPQDGEAGEAALAEQPAPAMLESALASTTKGKGKSGKLAACVSQDRRSSKSDQCVTALHLEDKELCRKMSACPML